jgi:hypothetical protein
LLPKPRCAGVDLDDLLRQANGRTVDLGERHGALDTAGLAVVAIESKWRTWLPATGELCRRRARRARHRALDRGGVHALSRRAQALGPGLGPGPCSRRGVAGARRSADRRINAVGSAGRPALGGSGLGASIPVPVEASQ